MCKCFEKLQLEIVLKIFIKQNKTNKEYILLHCLRLFVFQRQQFFYSIPEKIWWFGREQINKPILKHTIFRRLLNRKVEEMELQD